MKAARTTFPSTQPVAVMPESIAHLYISRSYTAGCGRVVMKYRKVYSSANI